MAVDAAKVSKSSPLADASRPYVDAARIEMPTLVSPGVVWRLQAYQKEGDAFVKQWLLNGVALNTLRDIFHQSPDNPMYDGYLVEQEQQGRLQPYIDEPIDWQQYDYFVECFAE